jgi:hypothetical protein
MTSVKLFPKDCHNPYEGWDDEAVCDEEEEEGGGRRTLTKMEKRGVTATKEKS